MVWNEPGLRTAQLLLAVWDGGSFDHRDGPRFRGWTVAAIRDSLVDFPTGFARSPVFHGSLSSSWSRPRPRDFARPVAIQRSLWHPERTPDVRPIGPYAQSASDRLLPDVWRPSRHEPGRIGHSSTGAHVRAKSRRPTTPRLSASTMALLLAPRHEWSRHDQCP